MQFMEHTNGNTITIGLQSVIIVQTAKICLLRQVKKIKFHFVYNFAQPQNSMNNILRPTTQSSTFHLTQNNLTQNHLWLEQYR